MDINIVYRNVRKSNVLFDFELSVDGNVVLLHDSEWNGYEYTLSSSNESDYYKNCRYVPTYDKFNQIKGFDIKF